MKHILSVLLFFVTYISQADTGKTNYKNVISEMDQALSYVTMGENLVSSIERYAPTKGAKNFQELSNIIDAARGYMQQLKIYGKTAKSIADKARAASASATGLKGLELGRMALKDSKDLREKSTQNMQDIRAIYAILAKLQSEASKTASAQLL